MKTALIVEDDSGFASVLSEAVRHLGNEWHERSFQFGADALHFVRNAHVPIDLVLIDLGLPDMSGIEVIRAVRARFPDPPVLVVSVLADEASVLNAIRMGASGYILKDDNSLSIARALEQVHDGIYPISPPLARYLFKLAKGGADSPHEVLSLSEKELEVLRCISRGCSYAETAAAMGISLSTVQSHIRNLYRKLGANSGVQALSIARDSGIIL